MSLLTAWNRALNQKIGIGYGSPFPPFVSNIGVGAVVQYNPTAGIRTIYTASELGIDQNALELQEAGADNLVINSDVTTSGDATIKASDIATGGNNISGGVTFNTEEGYFLNAVKANKYSAGSKTIAGIVEDRLKEMGDRPRATYYGVYAIWKADLGFFAASSEKNVTATIEGNAMIEGVKVSGNITVTVNNTVGITESFPNQESPTNGGVFAVSLFRYLGPNGNITTK